MEKKINRSTKVGGLTDDLLRQYESEFKLLRRSRQTDAEQSPPPPPSLSELNSSPDTKSGESNRA